ncbi:hypothetical protein [Amycolatopsis sp. EV170708-02-1]|nr:hypothetical protein [Amycolatopsis sp. EV170708-02-1]UMO99611.1 hypothetical protein MJQ72_24050 [Amycolatopsis sp. EV170708-02-1]
MPKTTETSDLKRLVDKDGTGNVIFFGAAPPGSRITGDKYDSRLTKSLS